MINIYFRYDVWIFHHWISKTCNSNLDEVSLNLIVPGTINNPSVRNMKSELEVNTPGIYNNVRGRQWVTMSVCREVKEEVGGGKFMFIAKSSS